VLRVRVEFHRLGRAATRPYLESLYGFDVQRSEGHRRQGGLSLANDRLHRTGGLHACEALIEALILVGKLLVIDSK